MDRCREAEGEEAAAESGCWTVVAAPFTRADRLRAFIAAVGGIEGVTGLVAERFRLGELFLTLRYSGAQPLAGCLAALPDFDPRVEIESSRTIRLALGEARPDG